MKTALYSRVSTLGQAKEDYSIHAQNECLEAFAELESSTFKNGNGFRCSR